MGYTERRAPYNCGRLAASNAVQSWEVAHGAPVQSTRVTPLELPLHVHGAALSRLAETAKRAVLR